MKKPFPYNTVRPATFEMLREELLEYSASLTPIERLAYLHELNIHAYGKDSLKIKDFGKIIKPGGEK